MRLILLIDFGSTYTKATAVNAETAEIAAASKAPTTVKMGIMNGLVDALEALEQQLGGRSFKIVEKIASSSAAGGLRMTAIGLVPELTAEAAKTAVLNAGARLAGCYSYKLVDEDMQSILGEKPDIILLAGGTDGGNQEVILHNAEMLAVSPVDAPILAAGNRACGSQVRRILEAAGKEVILTENVLPRVNRLNIEPVRRQIRELFIGRIVRARGIEAAGEYLDRVLMPTPAAVLSGARLLAGGTDKTAGLGELIVVDIGGATTDIHSIASGEPTRSGMIPKGLPEPYSKRTVEGDMGVRYNAAAILDEVGEERFAQNLHLAPGDVRRWVNFVTERPEALPGTEDERRIDLHLAWQAARISSMRHAGVTETHYTPMGMVYALYGKDLSAVKTVVGTGGPLVHSSDPAAALAAVRFDEAVPESLRPLDPALYLDSGYVLYAGGLLCGDYPELALRVMKNSLKRV